MLRCATYRDPGRLGVSLRRAGRDQVADVVGATLRWMQGGTALDELDELVFEDSELSLLVTDVGELVPQEGLDVPARDVTVVTDFDHASYLGEREPRGLCGADESQLMKSRVVVGAVTVERTLWWSEETAPFVVADRLGWNLRCSCELSDAHAAHYPLTLIHRSGFTVQSRGTTSLPRGTHSPPPEQSRRTGVDDEFVLQHQPGPSAAVPVVC